MVSYSFCNKVIIFGIEVALLGLGLVDSLILTGIKSEISRG